MLIDLCSLCNSPMHSTQMCHSFLGYSNGIHEQAYVVNDFRQPLNNPFKEIYTQGCDNHFDFARQHHQPMDYLGGQPLSMSCQYVPIYQTPMQVFLPKQPFTLPVVEQQPFLSLVDILKQFIQVTMQIT